LVSWKKLDNIHEDRKTNPVKMMILDLHNDVLYPDTKEVRQAIKTIKNIQKKLHQQITKNSNLLNKTWYSLTRNYCP